jgi:DNA-binding NarL/FixJ family response regulator
MDSTHKDYEAIATTKTILLVDDHAVLRAGLRAILASSKHAFIIEEAECFEEAMAKMRYRRCDAVVLDVSMPGKSGIETLCEIKKQFPRIPVLMLSVYAERDYGLRALKEGAAGCLDKSAAPEKLLDAVTRILAGGRYITPELAEALADQVAAGTDSALHDSLTRREFEVFLLLAQGTSATDAAKQLSLSAKTIYSHRRNILDKLGLASNADVAVYAYRNQLLW